MPTFSIRDSSPYSIAERARSSSSVDGGVVAILLPPIGARWVALLIGFAWLLEGISLLYAPAVGHRVLTIILAVLSVLTGVLVINLPNLGAVLTVAAVSSVLIVFGVVQIVEVVTAARSAAADTDAPASSGR